MPVLEEAETMVRTDGRAYVHVITKFSRMGRLPHFLSYGAPESMLLQTKHCIFHFCTKWVWGLGISLANKCNKIDQKHFLFV